ncbi:MAG: cytidylate kinase-like family protein [Eubacterium sp.]|nr:cytidylate kinase-like family protein [Eubacterium sp.]
MNQKIVIAINREYGSGGRTIGEMLSKDLGIHYYDKEILKLASDESGINEALFNRADNKFKGTRLFRIAKSVYSGELIPPESDDFTSDQNLFNYQAKIIKKLAEEESCIIVGRGAGFILRDYDNVVNIFIHAPFPYLIKNAANRMTLTGPELEKFVIKENKRREEYNRYYTGEEWDDAHHYDLCLDSSRLGYDKCVEVIKGYMKVRFDGLEF